MDKLKKQESLTSLGKLSGYKSIEDIVWAKDNEKIMSLAGHRKQLEDEIVLKGIAQYLVTLNDSLNVKDKMNEIQVVDCAKEILRDYYYLTFEDIRFCLDSGRKGHYGQVYGRLDISIIFDWLSKYEDHRIVISERNSLNKHHEITSDKIEHKKLNGENFYKKFVIGATEKPEINREKEQKRILAEYKKDPKKYMANIKKGL